MNKTLMVLLLTLSFMLTTACAGAPDQKPEVEKPTVTMISAEDAKVMLDDDNSIIIVDVRTAEEFSEEHIPNAILLPLDTIAEKAESVIPDKEAIYFVYCRSGNRSATASAQLLDMGYTNIYDLGGIIDWPYEKVKGQ